MRAMIVTIKTQIDILFFSEPLSSTADLIAKGNLDIAPGHYFQKLPDEIGLLARNLNKMRLNLKDQIENLDGKVAEKTKQLQTNNIQLMQEIAERKRAVDALLESEERFRYVTEFSPFPISILDSEGRYMFLNKKFIEIFGYTLEDIPTGKEWMTLAYPDADYRREAIDTWKLDYTRSKEDIFSTRSFKVRCKNEKIRDIIFKPITVENEKQFIIYEDITERKKAQEELKASEKKYRELINNSLDCIISVDSQMKIILWNPAAEKIFGYAHSEILGQPLLKIIPQRYRRATKKGFDLFRKSYAGPIIGKTFETEGLGKDGMEVPIELSVSAKKTIDNYIACAIIRDITDRKRAEAELKIKDSAIASSINAIAIVDLQNKLTYVNNSFLKMWGYKNKGRVIGKSAEKFWQIKQKRFTREEELTQQEAWAGEITAEKKDGSLLDIQISTNIVTDQTGKPVCRMASFVDLTERKYLEKQILEISETEQRKIGQDLHDGLGQLFTGTTYMSKALEQKLLEKSTPEAAEAAKIAGLINQAIAKVRNVAGILNPVKLEADGLMLALEELAVNVNKIFKATGVSRDNFFL